MVRPARGASLSRPVASVPHNVSPEVNAVAPNCASEQLINSIGVGRTNRRIVDSEIPGLQAGK